MPSAKTRSKYESDKLYWVAAIAFDGDEDGDEDGEAEAVAATTDLAVVDGVVPAACVKVTRTSAPVIVCCCVVSNVEVTKMIEVTISTMVVLTVTDAVTELI